MGLFSSKYETTVGTTVSRAIKDDLLPNSIRTGITKSIFRDTDISETVMSELVSSMGLRADAMYEYAKRSYTFGMPSGNFVNAGHQGQAVVSAVLAGLEGSPVEIEYSHFAPPNMLHIARGKLVSEHGYDPLTNQLPALSAVKGYPVYVDDITVVVPAATLASYQVGALDQWGAPATAGASPTRPFASLSALVRKHTPVSSDPEAATAHVRVDYAWAIPAGTVVDGQKLVKDKITIESFDIDVSGFDDLSDYWQVQYSVGTSVKWWMYQAGLGTYPTLDAEFDTGGQEHGEFFPFAYFRFDKHSEVQDKTTQAYKTTQRMVKYLGVDFDTVADSIDENPDIGNVEQAMLVLAVPANTTNKLELRYLYQFFENLYESDLNQFSSVPQMKLADFMARELDITKSSLVIQDARFKMALSNAGMTKRMVGGSIGKVDTYAMTMDEIIVPRNYYDPATDTIQEQQFPIKVHVYRHQVTAGLYEEIRVVDLKMKYFVFQEYYTTGDESDDILLIPIDRSVTNEYSIPDREQLYARALHYVFNSRVVTEVKWYQQDWFQFVMFAAAAVMTIMSFGSTIGAFSAAIAAGDVAALTTAALTLLENFVLGVAISEGLKLFAKAIGIDAAILIAVIAITYGGFQQFGGITGLPGAPWADQLLKLGTGLVKAISADLQDAMLGLKDEFASLQLLKDQTQKEFEAANKLLENNNWLSPITIFGESPNDFYNRTVHSGNIGVLSIGAISSYVDNALRLPKLDETIGDSAYV